MSKRICFVCNKALGQSLCISGRETCGTKCHDQIKETIRKMRPHEAKDGSKMQCLKCAEYMTLAGRYWIHSKQSQCDGNVDDMNLWSEEESEMYRLEHKMKKASVNRHLPKYFLTKKGRDRQGDGAMGQFLFQFQEKKFKDEFGEEEKGESSSAQDAKDCMLESVEECRMNVEGTHPMGEHGDPYFMAQTMAEHQKVADNINQFVAEALAKKYIVLDLHSYDSQPDVVIAIPSAAAASPSAPIPF